MTHLLFRLGLIWLTLGGAAASAADYPKLRFETSAGEFVVELDDARAPLTVANFMQYVEEGFYEGTIFHRVINDFVIQGGGFGADMVKKPPRDPIPNESGNGLSNKRLTLSMARTNDPHSGNSQFYINLANNDSLDPKSTRWGYAVFGVVVDGTDIIDDIAYRPTVTRGSFEDVPEEPIVIERVTVMAPNAAE